MLSCFLRNCSISHSYQQCMIVPIFPYLHQYLLLFVSLVLAILVSGKWYLIVVLICSFLITNGMEHFPPYLYCICPFLYILWGKCLFKHFAFLIEIFLIATGKSYVFWIQIPDQIYDLKVLYSILYLSFHFLDDFFFWSVTF